MFSDFLYNISFVSEFAVCLAYASVPLLCVQISPETWSIPAFTTTEIFGWIAEKMLEQRTNGYWFESETRRKLCKFINCTCSHEQSRTAHEL